MSSDITTETSKKVSIIPKKVPPIGALILISTIIPISMNIYLPSMAGMVDAFSTTSGMVQLTMSMFLVAFALGQVFLGPLSDRYGRRPIIMCGVTVYVAGSVLCLLATSIEALIAARMIQAVGGCAGFVLGRAIVRDLYERDRAASVIGYVTMGMSVGPMIGPVIGGFLDEGYGWRGSFYMMLAIGVVAFLVALWNVPETNHKLCKMNGIKGLWANYRLLLSKKLFCAYALVTCFTSSIYFAYLGGAPFISSHLFNMTASETGFYFMFVALGFLIGNYISGRISERIGIFRMILAGSILPALAVSAVAVMISAGLLHPLSLFLPMFFVGLGNGICLPSAISGVVSVRPDLAGAASGLSGSMQVGFGAVVSALVAWMLSDTMWPATVWPMVLVMIVCMLATFSAVFSIWVLERDTST